MISETPEAETPEVEVEEIDLPVETDAEDDTPEDAALEADDAELEDEDSDDDDAEEAEEGDAAEDDQRDAEPGDFDNLRLVEALLFASAEPLAPAQIARFLPEEVKLDPLLNDLQTLYANRGVNLVKRGGRWAFRTAEDLGPRMELENKVVRKLSRVGLETLAVIAYHQPVTRAEIEEIRGVALSKGTLDALLEIGWIRPKGRRKTPGRPVTWATSDAFLDHFGLEGLDALPGVEELKAAGLLDARPALTALGDRGLLPAAGEVAPEEVDEDEEEDEEAEGNERELLDATFGEDMLPQEVDLSATPRGEEAGNGAAAEAAGEDDSAVTDPEAAETSEEEADEAGDAEEDAEAATAEGEAPDEVASEDRAPEDQAPDDEAEDAPQRSTG